MSDYDILVDVDSSAYIEIDIETAPPGTAIELMANWSGSITEAQVSTLVNAAKAELVNGASPTMDQFSEVEAAITSLTSSLSGKANTTHSHSISDVASLQGSLDAKSNAADIGSTSDAAKGAALVGLKSTLTGATGRTLSSFIDAQEVNAGLFNIDWTGSTASTTGLQAAVTAASGKTLRLLPGTIVVTGATADGCIDLPAAGIRIVGAGKYATTIKMANTTASAAFVAVDASKVEIDHVGFDGQATARVAWQRALVFRGVQDCQITNCRFYRIGDGSIMFGQQGFGGSDAYGEGTRQPKRVRVTHCEFDSCWGTVALLSKYTGIEEFHVSDCRFKSCCSIAISIESQSGGSNVSRRTIVTNNTIYDCNSSYTSGLSTIAYGISLGELVEGVICTGNVVDTVTGSTLSAGILVSTSPSQTDTQAQRMLCANNLISTVTASSGRGYGVLLQAGDTSVSEIVIAGNVIWACEDGIGIEPDAGAKTLGYIRGVTISGNTITGSTEFGIWSNTLSSSGALPLIDSQITGNIIRTSTSHGISLKAQDCIIGYNAVTGSGGIGLYIASGSSKNTIVGNRSYANATDGMQINGDDTLIYGNACRNNGQGGATSYGIYVVAGSRVEIIGNDCSDDQGTPTQDYGLRAPNGTTVRSNKLIGNSTGTNWNGIANHNTGTYDAGLNRTA